MEKDNICAAARRLEELSFNQMVQVMDSAAATDADEVLAVKTHEVATMIRQNAEDNYEIVIDEKFAEQLANCGSDDSFAPQR